jgi:AcrR family transcriptional regulator
MKGSTPREKRQQKTRQAILDAARQIVAEQGSAELSMRGLAERIDYSPSGLYEYFDSKEAILTALIGEGHVRLVAFIQAVDEGLPPADYLVQIGVAYIGFALENPDLFRIMFSDAPRTLSEADLMSEGSSFPLLLAAIRRGFDAGVFKPGQDLGPLELAYTAWGLVHGIAMLRLYQRSFPPNFDQVEREIVAVLLRGLMGGG